MASLASAVGHAGIGLISYTTGLPVGDGVSAVKALLTRQRPASLDGIAKRVEAALQREIAVEHGGEANIAPTLATLDDLLARHGPSLEVVVDQHGLREDAVATAIMTDGHSLLVGIDAGGRGLIEKLLRLTYQHYLAERDLLAEIQRESLKTLLAENVITHQQLAAILAKLDQLTRPAEAQKAPFSIPQPVGDFKGYDAEIAAVQAALAGGSAAISAVQGIGGVRKTELAREVARRMRGDFPDGQILVDMLGTTQPRAARDAMTDVLKALGAEEIDPATLAADYQSRLAGKRVLILLDNVAERAGLDQLVPPEPAALLVTSRMRLALPGVVPVELERLSREASKALLTSILTELTDEQADGLAELCADLPLALRVAGAHLQATGYAVDAYLGELQRRRLARLAESSEDIDDATLNPAIVLGHSYDRLAESGDALARLFTLLGVFPADFEAAGAAALLGPDEASTPRQLGRLVQRGLVQPREQGRWRLHDLLRELANAKAEAAEREAATARHRGYYLALLRECEQECFGRRNEVRGALAAFETEQANISFAVRRAIEASDLEAAAAGFARIGSLASQLGRREDALSATEEAVDLYRRLARNRPDAFNTDLAMSLNNLGIMLDALGRREDALSATEEAVDLYRRLARNRPDAFNPNLALSLAVRANCLECLEQLNEACASILEAIELLRPTFLQHPQAVIHWMAPMCQQYVERCQKLGIDPDAVLLKPIAEVFQRLEDEGK